MFSGQPSQWRVKDRLDEARFFLKRLVETNGAQPDFRYYFSAAVGAIRSVPLILQKDLRSGYGQEFDRWWDERKTSFSGALPFSKLRDLRNTLQKEGTLFPRAILAWESEEGPIARVQALVDPSAIHDRVISIDVTIRSSDPMANVDIAHDAPKDVLQREMREPLRQLMSAANETIRAGERKVVGFVLSEGGEPLDFTAVCEQLGAHVDWLASVVTDAEIRFRFDKPPLAELPNER